MKMTWMGAVTAAVIGACVVGALAQVSGREPVAYRAQRCAQWTPLVSRVPTETGREAADYDTTKNSLEGAQECLKAVSRTFEEVDSYLDDDDRRIKNLESDIEAQKREVEEIQRRLEALESQRPQPTQSLERLAALEKEVAALKGEIAALRTARSMPSKVTAPFLVVDKKGDTVLLVSDGVTPGAMPSVGVAVGRTVSGDAFAEILQQGEALVHMNGRGSAGFVGLYRRGDTRARVSLGADVPQVAITDGQTAVLATMHEEPETGPMMAILSPGGQTLSGLGRNGTGGGRVFANTNTGNQGFIAGGMGGDDADACVNTDKRGLVCLRGLFFR